MWRPKEWERVKNDWLRLDASELALFERGADAMFSEITKLFSVSAHYMALLDCIKGIEEERKTDASSSS